MKHNHLMTRTLALALAATMCMTGNTGIQTFAQSVECSQQEMGVNDTSDTDQTAIDDTDSQSEENKDEPSAQQNVNVEEEGETDLPDNGMQVIPQNPNVDSDVDSDSVSQNEAETELGTIERDDADPEEESNEEIVSDTVETPENKLVIQAIPDPILYTAVKNKYNAFYASQPSKQVTDATFTTFLLMEYTGDLNFGTTVAGATNLTGLGYARKASSIDVSKSSATEIKPKEFYKCNLTKMSLPSTIRVIGDSSFNMCEKMESINLPDDVTYIGGYAFEGCSKLQKFNATNTLPSKINREVGTNTFADCKALTSVIIPGVGSYIQHATSMFANCKALTSVTIKAGLTNIPDSAFTGSGDESGMTVSIETGSRLQKIDAGAFKDARLTNIDLSNCEYLTSIGNSAFECADMKDNPLDPNEKIPAHITIKTVILPSTVKNSNGSAGYMMLGKNIFKQTELEKMYTTTNEAGTIQIPNYVNELGAGAFYKCQNIKKVILSYKLKAINKSTFEKCKKLETVTLDTYGNQNNCDTILIDNCAFKDTIVKNADFVSKMNNLKIIGTADLDITQIEDTYYQFQYNVVQEPVYGNDSLVAGAEVFTGCKFTSITLPSSLERIGSRAFLAMPLLTTVVWNSPTELQQPKSRLIDTEAFYLCTSLKNFTFPECSNPAETFEISAAAFRVCPMTNIKSGSNATDIGLLPLSLSKLDKAALMQCKMTRIKIRDRLDARKPDFEEGCFANCQALATVILPGTTETIAKAMFYDSPVSSLSLDGTKNNIKVIEDKAFFGCGFTTLDLSSYTKLNKLGRFAFAYVDNDAYPVYYSNTTSRPLTTVILPLEVEGDRMTLGYNLFHNATHFTTLCLGTISEGQAGKVIIPDYIANDDCEAGVFASTKVSEASWQFETSGSGKNAWTYIPATMFFACNVSDISKCLLQPANLKSIKEEAFMCCRNITTVDLRPYTYLSDMRQGVFSNCYGLQTVYMPDHMTRLPDNTFRIGDFDPGFRCSNTKGSLREVHLGGIKEIGDYAFSTVNEIQLEGSWPAGTVWETSLAYIDLSNVEKIGTGAFYGCTELKDVLMGNQLTDIGSYAFASCKSLVISKTYPIPDSVKTIGDYAFYRDESLCKNDNKVVIGSKMESIGSFAFAECIGTHDYSKIDPTLDPVKISFDEKSNGLQEINFDNAVKLNTIGAYAFFRTGLKNFEMKNSIVQVLPYCALYECPNLNTVVLGNSFEYIEQDSMASCPNLSRVNIFATTTISQMAFYSLDTGSGFGYTSRDMTFSIATDPVTIVGIGRKMAFPYYVSEYQPINNQTPDPAFTSLVIGNSDSNPSVEEYVNVDGRVAMNYYKLVSDDKPEHIVSSSYFTKEDEPQLFYTPMQKQVETFYIEGNKATPEGQTIDFFINTNVKFLQSDNTSPSFDKAINSQYHIKVQQMEYKTVLYTDYERKSPLNMTPDKQIIDNFTYTFQAQAGKQLGQTFFYKIKDTCASYSQPTSPNIVIETDNAAVAYPTNYFNEPGQPCRIIQDPNAVFPNMDAATSGLAFDMIPVGVGTANFKIYSEENPEYAVTMTVVVNSDISSMTLSIPEQYTNGAQPGDTFNIFENYQTCLGQLVERKDLSNFANYTNNVITYTSNRPEIASVDNSGNVTINKVSITPEEVVFTATAKGSGDYDATTSLAYVVIYPPTEAGKNTMDANTGAVVCPIEVSEVDNKGTAAYVAPPDKTATSVTIPSTVLINGVKYKVTEVASNAFKNNKYIKKVTIGKYVKKIQKNAFYGCKYLATVNFASGTQLQYIGESAFYNCISLKKITIPAKVTEIAKRAFKGDKKLYSIKFASKSRLVTLGSSVFEGCIALKSITIPSKVQTLGSKAFYGDKKLKSIVFKTSVLNSVGKNAFKNIYKKATIKVPKKKLDDYRNLMNKKGQSGSTKIKS